MEINLTKQNIMTIRHGYNTPKKGQRNAIVVALCDELLAYKERDEAMLEMTKTLAKAFGIDENIL